MEQFLYQRPRERLVQSGVTALSASELIQLVIGAGSARVSGAKLARQVAGLLGDGPVTYSTLVALNGLGPAKACQLLAALELSKRIQKGT